VADAETGMWKLIYGESGFLKDLLTSGQVRLLPSPLFNMVTTPANTNGRFFFGPAC
jgi:hypothetical protein